MSKKNISSLELAALVNDLQFLIRGKISQIYQQENKELLFQLHAQGKGKQLMMIYPGKLLHLTSVKDPTPLNPSSFCRQLRKYINNAIIRKLYQKDAERIVVFELEKEERYNLIIELFSKGNVILTDQEMKIITALERQIWKERTVKPGEKYIFPPSLNWKVLGKGELKLLLEKSEKKNLATALATEVGLGGIYAEETCKRAQVEKNKPPQEVSALEVEQIIKIKNEFLKWSEKPAGYIYDDEITPFALLEKKEKEKTKSYLEALSTLKMNAFISPYEKKIKNMERMIQGQEEAIMQLENKIKLNTEKGEKIYEKYAALQKLLEIVAEMKKNKEWATIAKELKKEKKITKVDLKEKKVTIDL